MQRFTSISDIASLPDILQIAAECKQSPLLHNDIGRNKTLGLLFFNPSLRTRMSTQKAAFNLGVNVIVMNVGADSWTLETRDGTIMDGAATEHIKEAAAVMGQYCDILGIRTFAGLSDREADYNEDVLEKFIRYCGVPVISLESATRHPLQSFADIITIETHKTSPRPKVVLSWAPHPKALPQAVPNSFAEWALAMNYDLTITHPHGYELHEQFSNGANISYQQDEALAQADFVYVKNWSSYHEYGKILSVDQSWMMTAAKLALTNNAKFMHCLPVRRNVIVADEVLDSDSSVVVEEAANRVVSAQAVLYSMLKTLP